MALNCQQTYGPNCCYLTTIGCWEHLTNVGKYPFCWHNPKKGKTLRNSQIKSENKKKSSALEKSMTMSSESLIDRIHEIQCLWEAPTWEWTLNIEQLSFQVAWIDYIKIINTESLMRSLLFDVYSTHPHLGFIYLKKKLNAEKREVKKMKKYNKSRRWTIWNSRVHKEPNNFNELWIKCLM